MPSLKQLNCSIELGNANVKLEEYGTVYSDGYVGTIVSVPEEEINFTIHLTSDGYIAPGIAMFVYIDGQYQCNRNRRGLIVPEEQTPPELFQVDLRVRQKETKQADTTFHGRAWSFHALNTVAADQAPKINTNVMDNIGTIEVVVLRCKETPTPTTSSSQPLTGTRTTSVLNHKALVDKPKVYTKNTATPAATVRSVQPKKPATPAASVKSVQKKKTVTPAASVQSAGMMGGLFDGPADNPEVFYREPPTMGTLAARATGVAGRGYNDTQFQQFQYRPLPVQTQPAYEVPPYHQPYAAAADFQFPQPAQFQFPQPPAQDGNQGYAATYQSNVPKYDYAQNPAYGVHDHRHAAQQTPHYQMYEPRTRESPPGDTYPSTSDPRGDSQERRYRGPSSQRWTYATPQSNEASYGTYDSNRTRRATPRSDEASHGTSDPTRRASDIHRPHGNAHWPAQSRLEHRDKDHSRYTGRRSGTPPRDEQPSRSTSKKEKTPEKGKSVVPGAWIEDYPKAKSPKTLISRAKAADSRTSKQKGSSVKDNKGGNDWAAVEIKDDNKPAAPAGDWDWGNATKDDRPASQAAEWDWGNNTKPASQNGGWDNGTKPASQAGGWDNDPKPSSQAGGWDNDTKPASKAWDWGNDTKPASRHGGRHIDTKPTKPKSQAGGWDNGKKPASQAEGQEVPKQSDHSKKSKKNDSPATKQSDHAKESKKRSHHTKSKPEETSQHGAPPPTNGIDGAPSPPRIKPYFKEWNKRPASILSDPAKAPKIPMPYIAPAEPLIPVAEDKAAEKGVGHQVRIGEAASYTHLVSRPEYLDSLEKPYAVFNFRYRSRKVVEKLCNVKIKERKEEFIKVKLADMSKAQLVEEMLKMKLRGDKKDKASASAVAGASSSSSRSSTTLRASSRRSMKPEEKVDDWAARPASVASSSTKVASSRHSEVKASSKSGKSDKSKKKSVVASGWGERPAEKKEASGFSWDNVVVPDAPDAPAGGW